MDAPQPSASEARRFHDARWRRRLFRSLTILFGLMMIFIPGAGLVDLQSIIPGVGLPKQGPFDAAHGIVTVVFVAGALFAQARAPQLKIAGLQQLALTAVAIVLSALVGLDAVTLVEACVLAVVVAVLLPLHPARRQFLARGRTSLSTATLALAGAIPLVVYALTMAARTRAHELPYPGASEDGPNDWLNFTAVALSIGLVAGLAALRTQGWRIPAWSAAAAALLLAVSWLFYPGRGGSEPFPAAALLALWSVGLLAVSEWDSRNRGADSP